MRIDINCKWCNELFNEWKSNKRVFCARACYVAYWHKNVSKRIVERISNSKTSTCPECLTTFKDAVSNKRKYCSRLCSNKHTLITAEKVSGSKNNMWKGGIAYVNHGVRTSQAYLDWRQIVLERDTYTCVDCGAKEDLQVDHILPFIKYPNLRIEPSNGQTLCVTCHKKKTKFCDSILEPLLQKERQDKIDIYGFDWKN